MPATNQKKHPRISLVDLPEPAQEWLSDLGYRTQVGSLGTFNIGPRHGHPTPVDPQSSVHTLDEADIAIIDLGVGGDFPKLEAAADVPHTATSWWASGLHEDADLRGIGAFQARHRLDRLLEHGGIIVVLSSIRFETRVFFGQQYYQEVKRVPDADTDNWWFLSALGPTYLGVTPAVGDEIHLAPETPPSLRPICGLLEQNLDQLRYVCTFDFGSLRNHQWYPLAQSKFGPPVAAALVPQQSSGLVLLLPRVDNLESFLPRLIDHTLPEIAPHLYPGRDTYSWLFQKPYELPAVSAAQDRIEAIEREAAKKVADEERTIEQLRSDSIHEYELLVGSGDRLVAAVEWALGELGFEQVVDVDQVLGDGDGTIRREDLRILDRTPALLVEVKGIGGLPREADCLQVAKYVAPRMKEWERLDVRGLTIINHQRHLPPLERQNAGVFQPDLVTTADAQDLGLLTTWDLHRLLRSARLNGWQTQDLLPVLYGTGRIVPVPAHYSLIGTIEHIWPRPEVVGIRLSAPLQQGNRLATCPSVLWREFVAQSVQVSNQERIDAAAGELAGVFVGDTLHHFRKGDGVWLAKSPTPLPGASVG